MILYLLVYYEKFRARTIIMRYKNHLWNDLAWRRDKLNEVNSLVGNNSEIIGERVNLVLKQDRLFTYGLISDFSCIKLRLNPLKSV